MVSVENNSILKKTIAVFMLMITAFVFLSFNVFADTPVQPLQVVTYSDTTTNVRISGTAERLHYNVDSFQVVFMNPPNNYGTACTPILVSFRFYNSSELPAYVGQAEFELTATTGTGAVNTIIYGYDQISTDLFVAESSYSTAEVGRIGIGASNDFAYYTGFVIPPRTSLYFSCIVYVNASAYGQNNTGATEDVNQVTLSSLNLYTNQLSFSDDYPYHNQPIDFSSIISEIQSLSNTVSSSSEMQSVIALLTYSGNSFNSSISNGTRTTFDQTASNVRLLASIVRGLPIYSTLTNNLDNSNDNIISGGTVKYPFFIKIQISNNSNNNLRIYYANLLNNILPNVTNSLHIEYFQSNYYDSFNMYSLQYGFEFIVKNEFRLPQSQYYNSAVLPPGTFYVLLTGYTELPIGTDPNFQTISLTHSGYFNNSSFQVIDGYYPINEYTVLKDLYLAYSQVNGLDDSSDISNDVADVSDSNHIIEESYYSANASAIEATGLSNYRFSNEQNNGIGKVADDFMLLWNALGSWNGVYIFSLTMALATFIMRHGGLFTIKREVSDKGGDGE